MNKIAEMRQKRDTFLATAQRIVSQAVSEGRELSAKESEDVSGLKVKAEGISATIREHDALRDIHDGIDGENEITRSNGLASSGAANGDEGLGVARMVRALAAAKGDERRAADYADRVFGDAKVAKALSTGSGPSGGFLVPEVFAVEMIEYLRPASAVRRLGAQTYPIPGGNASIPKLTGGSAATWIGEGDNIGVSNPTFGQVRASAKKLATLVPMSNDLLRFASPSADAVVRNDLVAAIAQAEDLAFIRGDGTGNAPRGLRSWARAANLINVNATVNVANVTADSSKLMLALMNANVRMLKPGWIMAPRTMVYLMDLRDANSNLIFPEMQRGLFRGYPFATTTQIPITLAVTGSSESEIYFVDFADVFIAEVPGLLIDASDTAAYHDGSNVVSAFSKDQTVVRVIMQEDFVLRHAESVAVLIDVDWA